MTTARHYFATAKPGTADVMEQELGKLADIVRALPGSLGFELARDLDNDHRFLFIEKWESVDAHKAAGAHIPREAFATLAATFAGPLEGSYFEYLKTI